MRKFGFPIEFTSSNQRSLVVSVHTGPSYTAQEFIDKELISKPVATFLDILAQWKGLKNKYRVLAQDQRVLVFEASPDLVSEPWQVASILGVINSATFLQAIDDDPFITSVTVEAGSLTDLTLEGAFEDMDRFAAACAGELSGYLGDEFQIEGVVQTDWPADAELYFFDVAIGLSKALDAEGSERAKKLFDKIETTLAATAFESDNSPEYLFDEGLIPFPVKLEITEKAIEYAIETPPSDISIPLVIARDTLISDAKAQISGWKVRIRERW